MPCFLYHYIIQLTRSRAENCAIERFTWPSLKPLLLQNQGSQVGKTVFEGKPALKTDLVEVEEKHTVKPGVHRGNNKSLNNNDHKLLNMAEWWQDFLKALAELWCFEDGGLGVRYDFNRTKGRLFVLLTLSANTNKQGEEAASERRFQSWCHVMFSHLPCSEWLAWFCLPQPFYFHPPCQHQC